MAGQHPSASATTRLASLDVFRGLTIAAMLIISNPGDFSQNYPLLVHAEWAGITPADLVFPFFLFIVGVALSAELRPSVAQAADGRRLHASSRYLRLARRAGILLVLGLLLNALPQFNPATWRIPGVLQRIALCYLAASMISLHVPLRWQWSIGAVILLGYAALLRFASVPGLPPGHLDALANLPRWVDLAVFSPAHLFNECPTDPEGLLSTPSAVVSVLLGCWAGHCLINRPVSCRWGMRVIASGFVCSVLGWAGSLTIPMVKIIWTPTYVLFAGGWAMMFFGLCYLLTDVRQTAGWMWVAQVFGRNAILSYVLSEVASDTLSVMDMHGTPFSLFVTSRIITLSGRLVSPRLGSLLYACLLTLTIWSVCWILYRRRWFIRV